MLSRWAVAVATVSGLAVLSGSSHAAAQQIRWDTPEDCHPHEQVEAGIVRLLDRPLSELTATWSSVTATIRHEAEGFRLTIVAVDAAGVRSERTLLATSCDQAGEAAIAILATSLTSAEGREVETEQPEPAEPLTPPEPAARDRIEKDRPRPRQRPSPPARAPDRSHLWSSLGTTTGFEFESVPAPTVFQQAMASVGKDRAFARAAAALTWPVAVIIENTNLGAEVMLLRGTLTACYRLGGEVLSVDTCAGAEIGMLHASGFGWVNARNGSSFWSAAVAELGIGLEPTTGVALLAGLSGLVPFRQPIVKAGGRELHQVGPLGGRIWLGVELRNE